MEADLPEFLGADDTKNVGGNAETAPRYLTPEDEEYSIPAVSMNPDGTITIQHNEDGYWVDTYEVGSTLTRVKDGKKIPIHMMGQLLTILDRG